MKNNLLLVGCIHKLGNKTIRTRFFYINKESRVIKDVTLELCNAIQAYNEYAMAKRKTPNEYCLIIPYKYKKGMAKYSFGCGLSHYLQQGEFSDIGERCVEPLSFPLERCLLNMYTPSDVKSILGCKGVFDDRMMESLENHFLN